MSLRVVTPAVTTLVSLDEAKAWCRVDPDETEFDLDLLALIAAAQREVESQTQRRFVPQTLEWVLDTWRSPMVLPVAPGGDCSGVTIDSVTYGALDGTMQVLDAATLYWSRPAGPTRSVVRRWYAVWPLLGDAAERVVIRFSITNSLDVVSAGVRLAMRLLISHWFRNREAVVGVDNRDSSTPLPFGVEEALVDDRWEVCA